MSEKDQMQNASALHTTMLDMGRQARSAARILATATAKQKCDALTIIAQTIKDGQTDILDANAIDVENAHQSNLSPALLDRLMLNDDRIMAVINGLKNIAALDEPVGRVLAAWDRPNGLHIKRISTPLGVIGVIYESRPNVTADAGALGVKSGNAVILRGGSDSYHSSQAIHACMLQGLEQADLPADAIQMVQTTDRAAVGEMLKGLNATIDVIIPRGGKRLVSRVQKDARVPVFAHLEGLCHIYVDKSANLKMAIEVVLNAKMRRIGICGAVETLLIDSDAVNTHLHPILDALKNVGCILKVEASIQKQYPQAELATQEDWATEYLDNILAVRLVDGIAGAIEHINQYSSHHTEAIIAENEDNVTLFFDSIDSAILLHNASTQFADGGEFGMGAEIGIATGKMHARGPVGIEQLTSFKYLVYGNGQIRA